MVTDCDGCGEIRSVNADKFCRSCSPAFTLTVAEAAGLRALLAESPDWWGQEERSVLSARYAVPVAVLVTLDIGT